MIMIWQGGLHFDWGTADNLKKDSDSEGDSDSESDLDEATDDKEFTELLGEI